MTDPEDYLPTEISFAYLAAEEEPVTACPACPPGSWRLGLSLAYDDDDEVSVVVREWHRAGCVAVDQIVMRVARRLVNRHGR